MNRARKSLRRDKRGFTGLEAAIVLTAFIVVAAVFSYVVLNAGFFSTQKAKAVVHTGVEQVTTSCELAGNVIGYGWKYNESLSSGNITLATFDTDGEIFHDKGKLIDGTSITRLTAKIEGTAHNYTINVTTDQGTYNFTLDGPDDEESITTNITGVLDITDINRFAGSASEGSIITVYATVNGTYYWKASTQYDNYYDTTNLTAVKLYLTLTARQSPVDMDKLTISYSDRYVYIEELPYCAGINASRGNMTMGCWNYTTEDTPEAQDNSLLEAGEEVAILITLPGYGVTANEAFTIELKPTVGATIEIQRTAPGQIDKTMILY